MAKMQYFSLAVIILLSLHSKSSLAQRSIDPEIQKEIDDFIQDLYLPLSRINGLGLTIVQNDGEVLYTTGYGMADVERGVPNQNSTQFLIGSVTKSFTSVLAIKHLHERFPDLGEGVLDTPIRRLLPEVNFTLNDRFRSEHATFRDLLAHRLCLFRDDLQLIADPFDTTEEVNYRTRYNPEICGIRSEFQYNNQMYSFAGELIGILANKPYEEAMQDLLNEIGMTDTAFVQRTDDFSNMPNRAMPYYVSVTDNETYAINTELVKRVKLYNAAGGLFVPPNDMAKYMRFLLNYGTIDGKEIVPRAVGEWMAKPSNMYPGYGFKQTEEDIIINQFGYGLGLFLSDYDGWLYVQHGGYFPPYRSQMSLYPTKNLAVFSSSNMGPAWVDPMVLHAFIFETIARNPNAVNNAMKLKESIDAEKEIKKNNAEKEFKAIYDEAVKKGSLKKAADIVGQYGSGSGGQVEVSEKFNEARNATEYYLKYGRWYSGYLEDVAGGFLFKIDFDTDVITDDYAAGSDTSLSHALFNDDELLFITITPDVSAITGRFKLGVRMDLLPPVPWAPDSCGPETA